MSSETPVDIAPWIAEETALRTENIRSVMALLDDNATVPFIARYRKEATGELDEVAIRTIQERAQYFRELIDRRQTVLSTIREQGKLTPELEQRILSTRNRQVLEDLYLPYRPKRRTRASIARERGLEPLATLMLAQGPIAPETAALAYVDADKDVADVQAALAGARDIVAEGIAEDADIRAFARAYVRDRGMLVSEVAPEHKDTRTKYEQYHDFQEPLATIPSHRFLAIRRGEREEILRTRIDIDETPVIQEALLRRNVDKRSLWADELQKAAQDAWKRLLSTSIETDVRVDLKSESDDGAVRIFANNLRELLMAAPLGSRSVIGIDPGLRTGCKVAVVNDTGTFLHNTTLYLSRGAASEEAARKELLALIARYTPFAIAVGNGTGGRETEDFVRGTLKDAGIQDVLVVLVNESGASVYSASDVAREEFPELDLTVRGAISIARRLQDPLAELVKIDPKSIGVGQYQHDVQQTLLTRKLEEVVESCVNAVGVELNTASAPLLAQVAGIGPTLAKRIVEHRNQNGAFASRKAIRDVAGLGPRTFEQCAGFLRVRESANPLDRSAVHPERYKLVETIAKDMGVKIDELVGNAQLADRIQVKDYLKDDVGEATLIDIIAELKKPGRDPRDTFEPPKFREDVREVADLKPGMILEGVVTNVTAFGAFVDIGVHQDGLVHVSRLSERFVRDPSDVAAAGMKLMVKVMDVDHQRKRISLTARLDDPLEGEAPAAGEGRRDNGSRNDRAGAPQGQRAGGQGPRDPHQRGQHARANSSDRAKGGRSNAGGKSANDVGANTPFADLLKRR